MLQPAIGGQAYACGSCRWWCNSSWQSCLQHDDFQFLISAASRALSGSCWCGFAVAGICSFMCAHTPAQHSCNWPCRTRHEPEWCSKPFWVELLRLGLGKLRVNTRDTILRSATARLLAEQREPTTDTRLHPCKHVHTGWRCIQQEPPALTRCARSCNAHEEP